MATKPFLATATTAVVKREKEDDYGGVGTSAIPLEIATWQPELDRDIGIVSKIKTI